MTSSQGNRPVNLPRFVLARLQSLRQQLAKRRMLRSSSGALNLSVERWPESTQDPNRFYLDCFRYFHSAALPCELQQHRHYFTRRKRGFGEDAFHVMWFLLFREFRPRNFLEIGVYRGQVISLVSLLAKLHDTACDVYGVAPFSSEGDQVSKYPTHIDYFKDTLTNFARFGLPPPSLLKAFSTDEPALQLISSRAWDMIYIDGNHDYSIAKRDWEACSKNLKPGGIIVLDDSALTTRYEPPTFATAGHSGPSRVAAEIESRAFAEILQVGHNRVFQRRT
jgi:hypothetical protein